MIDLNRQLLWTILVATVHLLSCFSATGLPEDKQQPIYVSSDRAQRDNQKNLTVYEGNVELTQGTLKILADKITLYHHNKSIDKIIATGKPAHYQQQPKIGEDDIIAKANIIKYEFEKASILLRGNASIYQDGATLASEIINYDIQSAVVQATSDERIQMVIPSVESK